MIQTHPGLDEQAVTVCLEAAKLIGKSLEPDIAIAGILRLLSQRLKLEKGRVVMPNPESGSLHIRYSYGLTEDEKQRGIYALGEGVTGRVITTGKIALIPDVTSEPTYLARVADLKDNNNQNLAYIAVPIVKDDTPIGVLAVHPLQISTAAFNTDLFVLQVLAAMIGQTLRIHALVQQRTEHLILENQELRNAQNLDAAAYDILGQSPALLGALKKAKRIAPSHATVMLIGESGAGKEKFARMIHLSSDRRDRPFICINCAAIPEQLLESELFGHEKGSFTGAISSRSGKFELASGGTLFLDEIGDMNLELQSKLLRVLQEKTIQRVGGQNEIPVDVRIISATNRNLEDAVNVGSFRLDLYYRLNVMRIQLPSLRERKADIRLLATYFLNRANQRYSRNIVLSTDALQRLESYDWPGNIRQLENVIERAVIMSEHDLFSANDVDAILQEEAHITVQNQPANQYYTANHNQNYITPHFDVRPYARVHQEEVQSIEDALRRSKGNKTLAAKQLGLTPRQLYYRLYKLDIRA